MTSDEIKQEVLQWIERGCDYNEGVDLYAKHGRNKTLMKVFPNREKIYSKKLYYELTKLASINLNTVETEQKPTFTPSQSTLIENNKSEVPDEVVKLSLIKRISKLITGK